MKIVCTIELKGANGFQALLEEDIECADREAGFAAIAEHAAAGFRPCNPAAIQSVTFAFKDA